MVLASQAAHSITAAERLREYFAMVRELSTQTSPHELLLAYRSRSQFIVPYDRILSLSRRGLTGDRVRITRSNLWEDDIDPWRSPDRLPVVSHGLLPLLIRTGRPLKVDALEVEPDDPIVPYADGMASLIASPIFHDGEPTYMVILMRAEPAAFTLDELSTLVLTSNLVGRTTSQLLLAQQLAEAYAALDREFRTVGELQRALLPRELPKMPGLSFAAHYETSARAGGDYYDFFRLDEHRLGMLVADVSGHGTPAAVVMAMMHATLHARPEHAGHPLQVVQLLNRRLHQTVKPGQFATAFYGVLDGRRRTLRYTLAGHDPPRVLSGDHDVTALPLTDGMPLAIVEHYENSEQEHELQRGDRLLMFTDGVTETFSTSGEMFGLERLDAALRRCRKTPEGMIDCIRAGLAAHAGDGALDDDRTLVAVALD